MATLIRELPANLNWQYVLYRLIALTFAAIVGALAVVWFLNPAELAPGGVTGLAIVLNNVAGLPIGLVVLVSNAILMAIGYRVLGRIEVLVATGYYVAAYAVAVEISTVLLPNAGISDDRLLAALFGGIVSGISVGIVFNVGATAGGSTIISRILQLRFGIPLTTAYLYADTFVIVLAGLAFGWEAALYAMVALFISGLASDYIMEGPSVIRTCTIITDYPEEVSQTLINGLQRSVTAWLGTGMYTHKERTVLFITIRRSEVNQLRQLIEGVDPAAFVVIGQGHVAYGAGFKRNGSGHTKLVHNQRNRV